MEKLERTDELYIRTTDKKLLHLSYPRAMHQRGAKTAPRSFPSSSFLPCTLLAHSFPSLPTTAATPIYSPSPRIPAQVRAKGRVCVAGQLTPTRYYVRYERETTAKFHRLRPVRWLLNFCSLQWVGLLFSFLGGFRSAFGLRLKGIRVW